MNSGFSDFQDLLNITTSGEDLQAVQDELKALEEEVADNKLDITANTLAIGNNTTAINTNTTNISNNGVLISNNTSAINTNTNNIITNSGNISTNTGNIAVNTSSISNNSLSISNNTTSINNLNNTSLLRDGSVQLDSNFTPTNTYDLVSKDYVDSHSTSTAYLKVDGSNSMTGNLNLDSNILNLNSVNSLYTVATDNIFISTSKDFTLLTFNTPAIQAGQNLIIFSRNLNLQNNDINNCGNINGISPAQITTNQTNISNNTNNITTNTNNISTNTNNITTNTNNIITNTNNITTNTNNIATNTSNIATKLNKSGDTMTGDLNMSLNNISFVNDLTINGNLSLVSASSDLIVNYMIPYTQTSGFPITIEGDHGLQTSYIQSNGVISSNLRCLSNLDMVNNNILNIGTINSINPSQISTNQNNITTNTNNITTNTNNISTNTNNITTNTNNIITNTNNITTNTNNISTNTSNILTKLNKSGDTMTGDLKMNTSTVLQFGENATNAAQVAGLIKYDVVSTTKHEIVLIGGQSTLDTNNLRHVRIDANLEVDDNLTVNGYVEIDDGLKVIGDYGDMWGSGGAVGSGFYGLKQLWLKNTSAGGTGTGGDAGWFIGNQYSTTTSNDNDLYFQVQYYNGTQRLSAYIQDATTNVRMNFTGQHRCMPDFKFSEDKIGLIVEATGRYMNLITEGEECSQISCISINDSIPVVTICNEEKSKKVFGVISNEEEKTRTWTAGNFGSFYDKVEGDHRLYINSIGEGGIWVCNKNGNLENGDYICSAGINGYGMRQATVNLTNYTVAKITMDCNFNPQLEEVKIWENGGWTYTGKYKPQYEMIELDDGLKIAFVGCTYHSG